MTAGRLAGGGLVAIPVLLLALGVGYVSALSPLLALAAVAAVALAYLVVAHAEVMMLVLVAALPWDNALAFPTETLSAVKVLGALLVVAYLIRALAGRVPLRLTPSLAAVAALVLLVAGSLLFSSAPGAGLTKTLRYVQFAAFFFLVLQLAEDRQGVIRVMQVATLSVTAAAVWALVNFLGADSGLLGDSIGDPNDFGFVMVATLPMALFLATHDRGRGWLWAVAGTVLVVATLATFSRGALVGFAALVLWALATRRVPRLRVVAALLAVASVAFIAFSLASPVVEPRLDSKSNVAQENVASRKALWLGAVYMAADHPLTGVGPGRFGVEAARGYVRDNPQPLSDPVTHNAFLEVLGENGVPAFCVFVGLLAGTWVMLVRTRRRLLEANDSEGARIAVALEGSLVAAIAAGMFISAQVLFPYWLIAALAGALAAQRAVAVADSSRPRPDGAAPSGTRAVPAAAA